MSQLQRDLQDSLEREADLREQLKFAEEEVVYCQSTVVYTFILMFTITGTIAEKETKPSGRRKRIFGDAIEKNGNEERERW